MVGNLIGSETKDATFNISGEAPKHGGLEIIITPEGKIDYMTFGEYKLIYDTTLLNIDPIGYTSQLVRAYDTLESALAQKCSEYEAYAEANQKKNLGDRLASQKSLIGWSYRALMKFAFSLSNIPPFTSRSDMFREGVHTHKVNLLSSAAILAFLTDGEKTLKKYVENLSAENILDIPFYSDAAREVRKTELDTAKHNILSCIEKTPALLAKENAILEMSGSAFAKEKEFYERIIGKY